jgi:hypothetical protein
MVSPPEQERFKEFREKKKESHLQYKDKICIIIYGAYNPPRTGAHLGEKERLEKLRDRLKDQGYSKTYIVDDFEGNDALNKSLDALRYADLNIFVFTCRGKTDSVTIELSEAIDKNMLWQCLVYEEVYKESYTYIPAMGRLLKEKLKANRYFSVEVPIENDDELYLAVSSDIYLFLRGKYVSRLAIC